MSEHPGGLVPGARAIPHGGASREESMGGHQMSPFLRVGMLELSVRILSEPWIMKAVCWPVERSKSHFGHVMAKPWGTASASWIARA